MCDTVRIISLLRSWRTASAPWGTSRTGWRWRCPPLVSSVTRSWTPCWASPPRPRSWTTSAGARGGAAGRGAAGPTTRYKHGGVWVSLGGDEVLQKSGKLGRIFSGLFLKNTIKSIFLEFLGLKNNSITSLWIPNYTMRNVFVWFESWITVSSWNSDWLTAFKTPFVCFDLSVKHAKHAFSLVRFHPGSKMIHCFAFFWVCWTIFQCLIFFLKLKQAVFS